MLSLEDFTYELPPGLIAQEPVHPRDAARLMLINRQTQEISHHHIHDLPALLDSPWGIVANNTKVFPARILGHKKTGGKVEILLLAPLGNSRYECICRPGLRLNEEIVFGSGLVAAVVQIPLSDTRTFIIEFNQPEKELRVSLSEQGTMPTPPYIKKMLSNADDYQTVYAKYGFSAAAPTAGLHFTAELLEEIQKAHPWYELTLNVGLGTFLPVKSKDIAGHHMHREAYTITAEVASSLNKRTDFQNLLAIGTTTTRALESSLDTDYQIQAMAGETGIFIYPPYRFHTLNGLLTNFHLPESTLLMMVSAFVSAPNTDVEFTNFADSLIGRAYAEAIKERYRFFSFGDAMLII